MKAIHTVEGPGKYDDQCEKAAEMCKANQVILVVFDGEHGPGFSARLTGKLVMAIPKILRKLADDIEEKMKAASQS